MDEWGFWITAGVMVLAVGSALLAALLQRQGDGAATSAYDLQVYRAQLAEVDRDLAAGVQSAPEAERLRAEISRRILEADRMGRGAVRTVSSGGRGIAGFGIVAAIAAAVWGYWVLGAPGYADLPIAARLAAAENYRATRPAQAEAEAGVAQPAPVVPDAQMADLMGKLRAAVKARPGDVQGLTLLVRNEAALGNLAAARDAQLALIAAKAGAAVAQDHVLLAELLIRLAGGYVSPEAEAALTATLALDPANGTALYYSGLMFAQGDRADHAFTIWNGLLEKGPADAPWMEPIKAQIAEVAARAGEKYQAPTAAGPDAAEVAAAAEMSPEDRQAMVQSMVDGLSERLATKGGPVEDWARLITSLAVLGDVDQARAIYRESKASFAGRAAELATLAAAAAKAGVAE